VKGLLLWGKTSGPSDFDKTVRFGIIFLILYALYKWLFCSKKAHKAVDDDIQKLETEIQRLRQEFIDKYGVTPEADSEVYFQRLRWEFIAKYGFDPDETESE
jgi:hypothetical protein